MESLLLGWSQELADEADVVDELSGQERPCTCAGFLCIGGFVLGTDAKHREKTSRTDAVVTTSGAEQL